MVGKRKQNAQLEPAGGFGRLGRFKKAPKRANSISPGHRPGVNGDHINKNPEAVVYLGALSEYEWVCVNLLIATIRN